MAGEYRVTGDIKATLTLAGVLAVIALLVGDSTLGFIVGLIDALLLFYVIARVPIRLTMFGLLFFVMILPNPGEGVPTAWDPPFTKLGAVLLNHINTVDRSFGATSFIILSGFEIAFIVMGIVIFLRKSSRSTLDTWNRLPTPKPMITLALVSLAATVFTWFSGLARGGDFGMSLWQLNCVLYLPIVFLLFQYSLRGPSDMVPIAKIVLVAAVYKSFLALYVVNTFQVHIDGVLSRPAYGTSHNDSMLFALAFVIVLAPVIEGVKGHARRNAALLLPILLAGTQANNRRLAWVQIALVFLTLYLISRESPLKRKIRRAVFASIPVLAIYTAAGWNTQYGKFYKPVQMMRSVVDAKSDGSSQWREFENVNIIATFRDNPLIGSGFGHPYKEVIVLPAVDYPLERYTPHNSLLGVWCYGGVLHFTCLTLLWAAGVYFAMRAYHNTTDASHRVAALVSFGGVLVYMLQAWGDLGLGSWQGVFIVGGAVAMSCKLAVANGQWQLKGKPVRVNPAVSAPPPGNAQA